MKPRHADRLPPPDARAGFTLVEILVATGIALTMMTAVMTMFIWTQKQTLDASRITWSHSEAIKSSRNLVEYLRSASEITGQDTNDWTWLEVRLANGSLARLVYVNPVERQRDGYMYLSNAQGRVTIVARGLTRIMQDGYSPPIFTQTGPASLRVRYRVVEPVANHPGEIRDETYGAVVDTEVFFRNAVQ